MFDVRCSMFGYLQRWGKGNERKGGTAGYVVPMTTFAPPERLRRIEPERADQFVRARASARRTGPALASSCSYSVWTEKGFPLVTLPPTQGSSGDSSPGTRPAYPRILCSTSSCKSPFVAMAVPDVTDTFPLKSVKRPPASSTKIGAGPRSQGLTPASSQTSARPSRSCAQPARSP